MSPRRRLFSVRKPTLGFEIFFSDVSAYRPTGGRLLYAVASVGSTVRLPPMIASIKCRERALECREMADHAPNLRVQSILIDMSRTWTRLALEAEQCEQTRPPAQHVHTPPE